MHLFSAVPSWVAGLPLSARPWQVRTDSPTDVEVLTQHANQANKRTRALHPCQGPQAVTNSIPLTKVVIKLSGHTSTTSCQACRLAEGCCQWGWVAALVPWSPRSALWWAVKQAVWQVRAVYGGGTCGRRARNRIRWTLDRQEVSACWGELTQTSAGGPKLKPQTGQERGEEREGSGESSANPHT